MQTCFLWGFFLWACSFTHISLFVRLLFCSKILPSYQSFTPWFWALLGFRQHQMRSFIDRSSRFFQRKAQNVWKIMMYWAISIIYRFKKEACNHARCRRTLGVVVLKDMSSWTAFCRDGNNQLHLWKKVDLCCPSHVAAIKWHGRCCWWVSCGSAGLV